MSAQNDFSKFMPEIACCIGNQNKWNPPSPSFSAKLNSLFSRIYPVDLIEEMKTDGYDPIIVGYEHDPVFMLTFVVEMVEKLKLSFAGQVPKIALEILPPRLLDWTREFLRDEKEYKEKGTIKGQKPTKDMVRKLKKFRADMCKSCSPFMLLCLLQNEFGEVFSIEHEDVMNWIEEDEKLYSSEEGIAEDSVWAMPPVFAHDSRIFYTAVKRDLHGLKLISEKRPDVICVGVYHAIKYDFLLGRSGERSFYGFYNSPNINWEVLQGMWIEAHKAFLR